MGLDLWQGDDLSCKLDYFLCLPNRDFSGTCGKKARYTDAQGFSSALLSSLRTTDGAPLLLPAAVSFWSEHSDRAGLDSWLASLSVGEDMRRFVGRWAVKGSEDSYVRTAARICENCQRLAAHHARAQWQNGPDFFGEEGLLEQLEFHLVERAGAGIQEVADQLARLRAGNYALTPELLGSLGDKGVLQLETETSAGDGDPLEGALQPVLPGPEAAGDADQDLEKADLRKILETHAVVGGAPPTGFLVSVTRGGLCRRLHYAGFCFRVPGEHIRNFEDWGETEPADHVYNLRCKDCFPIAASKEVEVEASDADGSSSDSGPSSAEEEAESE